MKKLQKLKLNNKAKIMTAPQMKYITGGYNDHACSGKPCYVKCFNDNRSISADSCPSDPIDFCWNAYPEADTISPTVTC